MTLKEPEKDVYVAILAGGLSKNDKCAGSAVFLVALEQIIDGGITIPPGGICSAVKNGGAITIVDLSCWNRY